MEGERAEVVRDLRELARKMRDVADAMRRLHMGVNVDDHAVQMTGAAAIADGWANGIERESYQASTASANSLGTVGTSPIITI